MPRNAAILVLLVASSAAFAQQPDDLLGRWTFEVEAAAEDPRCGAKKTVGEMKVTKKVTARAYRGVTTTQGVSEQCGVIDRNQSGFTLRVRDEKVTIEYDNELWTSDSLVLDGDTLSGFDSAGNAMGFVRMVEQPTEVTAADVARLDEFLQGLAPEFSAGLRAEFGQKMLQNLRRTGLSRDESVQVATQTIERMTDCILAMAREEIMAQSLPIDDIIADKNATILLQPENLDYREIECIYEAAQNAGVVIR
jgi:hypothetical protein